jgi:putative FmdB family regulatory protein
MPIYEYRCTKCGHVFEVMQKFSDKPVKACVSCSGKKVEKLISQSSFVLKGNGWHATDYGKNEPKAEAKPECAACPSACPTQG